MTTKYQDIIQSAQELRWDIGSDFHEKLMESLYTDATQSQGMKAVWFDVTDPVGSVRRIRSVLE